MRSERAKWALNGDVAERMNRVAETCWMTGDGDVDMVERDESNGLSIM
jgi:hypothetical protein